MRLTNILIKNTLYTYSIHYRLMIVFVQGLFIYTLLLQLNDRTGLLMYVHQCIF